MKWSLFNLDYVDHYQMKDGQYGTRNCLFSTIVKATSNELKFSLLQMLFEADISAHGEKGIICIINCDV